MMIALYTDAGQPGWFNSRLLHIFGLKYPYFIPYRCYSSNSFSRIPWLDYIDQKSASASGEAWNNGTEYILEGMAIIGWESYSDCFNRLLTASKFGYSSSLVGWNWRAMYSVIYITVNLDGAANTGVSLFSKWYEEISASRSHERVTYTGLKEPSPASLF